jgi:sulfite exporter TauE/SafE
MELSKLTFFFVQGILIGSGPCFLTCAPLVLPLIAGTTRNRREGLATVLVFGLARVSVYTLMAGLVGYLGADLFRLFYSQNWALIIRLTAALFIILIGGLMIAGRQFANPLCVFLQRQTLKHKYKSLIVLGLIVALAPCLPLIAVLTEIMFAAEKFYQGWLYGLSFGLGTLISPLLILGALLPDLSAKFPRLNIICGLLLIAAGLFILFK